MPRAVLIALAVVAAALVAAQVVLPRLAERRLRDDLAGAGQVRDVDVDALPAVTLLAGRADAVRIRLGAARSGAGDLGAWIGRADGVDRVDVRADRARFGPLDVTDARLRKDGEALEAQARVSREALAAASPAGVELAIDDASGGRLRLLAQAGPVRVGATAAPRDGALVVAAGGLLGAVVDLTVFEHPEVRVTGIDARPDGDGLRITVRGVTAEPPGA